MPSSGASPSKQPGGLSQGPSQNVIQKKSGRSHVLGELPKLLGFPFNISTTAEASDFKFGMQLGFVKAHHKMISVALGYGNSLNFCGSPLIFLQQLRLAISNLVCDMGLPLAHHKITR